MKYLLLVRVWACNCFLLFLKPSLPSISWNQQNLFPVESKGKCWDCPLNILFPLLKSFLIQSKGSFNTTWDIWITHIVVSRGENTARYTPPYIHEIPTKGGDLRETVLHVIRSVIGEQNSERYNANNIRKTENSLSYRSYT